MTAHHRTASLAGRWCLQAALSLCLAWTALAAAGQPVSLDPRNPHYLRWRGRPVVIVSSGEHYGAVLNPDLDYRHYLEALADDGMNYTRLFTGSYVEKAGAFGIARNTLAPAEGRFLAPWARSDEPGYAGGGNRFDLARWDARYFERLRDFVSLAGARGILVEVTLFSSTYTDEQWSVSPFNPTNNVNRTALADWRKLCTSDNGTILAWQEKLVRKLVQELNPYDNVLFEIQNEPWSDRTVLGGVVNPYLKAPARDQFPNSVDLADAASLRWQARVAAWITSEEARLPQRHLIAQNYCNFRYPVRPANLAKGVSIVNFHYAYPEAAAWNLGLDLPLAYDETGFLGARDEDYRQQAWNFLLAGGAAFNHLDYSFTVGHEEGSDTAPNGPGGGSPALRRQLRQLRTFMESIPFLRMAPDYTVVRSSPGCTWRALSEPGRHYAIYFNGTGASEVELALPPGNYQVEWIDPASGAVEVKETIIQQDRSRRLRSPAFATDMALRLHRLR